MLKKKLGKKALAFASAAVMAVSATATGLTALSMTAFAGEELGEGTFENGKGLPWHICENATAVMKFDITDGIYAIKLENIGGTANGGESRWDCQFRHRNLTIESGHTYRITYSVNPSNSGHMYPKLGNMSKDDQELWHSNGDELSLSYEEGLTQEQLEEKLKSASKTGNKVDYGQGWDAWYNKEYPANQWTTVAYEFQATETVKGTAEWTFHMGGQGNYAKMDCFPKDTIIRFDNLALIDMTDDASDYKAEAAYVPTGVEVNQVGYYPNGKKVATVVLSEGDTTKYDYEIKDASGSVVYSGTTDGNTKYDESGAWDYTQQIDFTDFTTEGKGYTLTVAGKTSKSFDIDKNLYEKHHDKSMLTYALNYFYQNRAMDTEDKYIPSPQSQEGSKKTLARKDSQHWPTDNAYIADKWVYIYTSKPSYSQSINVAGGWFDAGDYGKYVVNGGISLWTLMNMYERSLMVGKADKFGDNSTVMSIPEAGNGTPDILDECKVELDFFLEMMRDDGMVYHKAHDYKWTGLAVAPYDKNEGDKENKAPMRIVKPVTYAATLNASATFAQAARLFKDYDAAYAKTMEDAAIKTYAAAQKNFKKFSGWGGDTKGEGGISADLMYAPLDQNKGGGPYGDTEVSDEFYWAACELYITTGDKTYYDELMKYGTNAYGTDNAKALEISTTLVGGENNGSFSLFTWGTLNSVGSISLYVNSQAMLDKGLLTQDEVNTLKAEVLKAADSILEVQDKSAYGIPYVGHDYDTTVWKYNAASGTGDSETKTLSGGYEWGSNSMVINNSMALALAYDASKEVKYIDGVTTSMDYLMGRNPLEQGYVTGYGEHSTAYPHHRWWSGQLNSDDFPYAPYGVLSGGPNSNMEDPMVQGQGYKVGSIAPMMCYLDNVEAWSVNECTINWNSPLCWVASFLDDEAPYIERDPSSTTTATSSTDTKDTTTTTAATTAASTDASDATTDASNASTTDSNATTTSVTAASITPGQLLLGDTNLDGAVDVTDAVLLNKKAANVVTFNAQQMLNGDCYDQNGEIDGNDATALLKFLVHILKGLPENSSMNA